MKENMEILTDKAGSVEGELARNHTFNNAQDAAREYLRRGWAPIPIKAGDKKPALANWPELRITEEKISDLFLNGNNIGILLGEPSCGLVDVDIDAATAIAAAELLLPPTGLIHGRPGKPRSHYWFCCDPIPPAAKYQDLEGAVLVELRSNGQQTVVPPSAHPSGEAITWHSYGEPIRLDGAALADHVARLAAATLLAKAWPRQGSRHEAALALAGALLNGGIEDLVAAHLVRVVAQLAGDEEADDRFRAAEDTARRHLAGEKIVGGPTLAELVGDLVYRRIAEWLRLDDPTRIVKLGSGAAIPALVVPARTPIVRRLAEVERRPVRWLWADRIARGKVSMVVGDPGLGKSLLTVDIAAIVSRGACWPDRPGQRGEAGDVVLIGAEDDLADTVLPRLEAAGADVSRVVALEGISEASAGASVRLWLDLRRDLPLIEATIAALPDPRLIVIDPISAFLGGVDTHKNSDVRGVLGPLAELAARTGTAILCVSHLNKSGSGPAVYRTTGSLAFTAAARAVWAVSRDREDKDGERRLFLPVKNNLGPDRGGLAYRLEPAGDTLRIIWSPDPVFLPADEALTTERDGDRDDQTGAAEWLLEALAGGPRPSDEVVKEGRAHGWSEKQLRTARERMGVVPSKAGYQGKWIWSLPTKDAQDPKGAQRCPLPDGAPLGTFEGEGHLCKVEEGSTEFNPEAFESGEEATWTG
ncbi:MAG: AAA family ATPase [Planctomycetes bacterium]|nr:AAA family ATPase [Planctomycetota bacterium]